MYKIHNLQTIKDLVRLLIKSENIMRTDFKSLVETDEYKKLFHKLKKIPNN